MTDTTERSGHGDPIITHGERKRPFAAAQGNPKTIEKIGAHLESHLGTDIAVFHEIVSDLVHLDLYHVRPSAERNYHTLVTCGMSDLAMHVPPGCRHLRYAELLLSLPADWPLTTQAFEDERNYWPLRLLKTMARMPHEHRTWLGYGHTLAFSNPPEPFAEGTKLAAAAILTPALMPPSFVAARISWLKTVNFYALVPLHAAELEYKMHHGVEALEARLRAAGFTELLDPTRPSVV